MVPRTSVVGIGQTKTRQKYGPALSAAPRRAFRISERTARERKETASLKRANMAPRTSVVGIGQTKTRQNTARRLAPPLGGPFALAKEQPVREKKQRALSEQTWRPAQAWLELGKLKRDKNAARRLAPPLGGAFRISERTARERKKEPRQKLCLGSAMPSPKAYPPIGPLGYEGTYFLQTLAVALQVHPNKVKLQECLGLENLSD